MVNDSSVEVMRKISFNPIYDIFAYFNMGFSYLYPLSSPIPINFKITIVKPIL